MNKSLFSIFTILSVLAAAVNGYSVGAINGGSSFAVGQRLTSVPVRPVNDREMHMMGKKAKFGIFSPAVYLSKIALGEPKLNKLRGKGIGLHSGVIGDFTKWSGAYHLRTKLIKLAKTNGDVLGFLV
mmetsp:Transcript_7080/g.10454  ORF Transcript_7080/g.10454 Transcript_7080/m.10454 type:complete len:127 (+) Transcript_7080:40-420(+)